MKKKIPFPSASEYPAYAEMYLKWVKKDGTLLELLEENYSRTLALVQSLPSDVLLFRYAEHKWTIKEVLVHIVDDERIYAYRALAFARNDKTKLPGFEQDDYTRYSEANERSLENIMAEYNAVRRATLALFDGFSATALQRMGMADGHTASVRALGYHIAGHELHHTDILQKKYLRQ